MVKDYKDLQVGHICRIPNPVSRISQSGITLIEMIAVIVVVGLAIPAILLMWQDLSFRSGRAEVIAQATFYAQELMEEIKSKRFDESDTSPWTPSDEFGANRTDENDETDRDKWDDVDDFNGYFDFCNNQGVCDDDSSRSYRRDVTVDYARLNTTNDPDSWESCGSVSSCVTPSDCTNCNECCYKHIEVSVSHRFGDSSMVTIVSGY
jgi:MSHA pilin protein MshD